MPRSSHGDKYTVSVMKTVEDRGEEMRRLNTRKILKVFIAKKKTERIILDA